MPRNQDADRTTSQFLRGRKNFTRDRKHSVHEETPGNGTRDRKGGTAMEREREGQRRIKDEGETTNRCGWQRGEGSRERFTLVARKKRKTWLVSDGDS